MPDILTMSMPSPSQPGGPRMSRGIKLAVMGVAGAALLYSCAPSVGAGLGALPYLWFLPNPFYRPPVAAVPCPPGQVCAPQQATGTSSGSSSSSRSSTGIGSSFKSGSTTSGSTATTGSSTATTTSQRGGFGSTGSSSSSSS